MRGCIPTTTAGPTRRWTWPPRPACSGQPSLSRRPSPPEPSPEVVAVREPPAVDTGGAVELEVRIPPSGVVALAGHQQVWLGPAYADRTVTVWADLTSVHVTLDGHHIKTVSSRLSEPHLRQLRQRGARPAGPEPALLALPQRGGRHRLPPNVAIDVDRAVGPDGFVRLAGTNHKVHPNLAGQRITLRLDGHLAHAIANDTLITSWPYPISVDDRLKLKGARRAPGTLPQAAPVSTQAAQRRVPDDGIVMVARQRLRIGRAHAGKTVTIIAEDGYFRILDGEHELATHARTTTGPLTRFKASAHRQPRQASPENKPSTIS